MRRLLLFGGYGRRPPVTTHPHRHLSRSTVACATASARRYVSRRGAYNNYRMMKTHSSTRYAALTLRARARSAPYRTPSPAASGAACLSSWAAFERHRRVGALWLMRNGMTMVMSSGVA